MNSYIELVYKLPNIQTYIYITIFTIFAAIFKKRSIISCLKYYFLVFILGYIVFYSISSILTSLSFHYETYIIISKTKIFYLFLSNFTLVADGLLLLLIFRLIHLRILKNPVIFYTASIVCYIIYECFYADNIIHYILLKLLFPIYKILPDTVLCL